MRAVFLDRDGVINKDVGYLRSWQEFNFIPGSKEAISLLCNSGFSVIVVTNQSGIARGYFSEEALSDIHEKMKREIEMSGGHIDGIYYCPHMANYGCRCRKPDTGMMEQAAKEHDIDLSASYMVGDKPIDIETGKRIGCKTILVRTGYGSAYSGPEPDLVADNLLDAARMIVNSPV